MIAFHDFIHHKKIGDLKLWEKRKRIKIKQFGKKNLSHVTSTSH